MAEFKCINCEYTISKSKVKFIEENGDLVPEITFRCPVCDTPMELIPYSTTIGEVSFTPNKFASLSSDDKKAVLKKRSQAHFQRFDKAAVEEKRQSTIASIKQKFEEGIR